MDFSKALYFLKQGYKIKRSGWNGVDQYVSIAEQVYCIDKNEKEIKLQHKCVDSRAMIFHGTMGTQIWAPSQSDILASDWSVEP